MMIISLKGDPKGLRAESTPNLHSHIKIKNKMKFTHFQSTNGKKVNSIQIYVGNLNLNEFMDDVEVQMDIVNGEIQFTILNQHYYDKNELREIKSQLKMIDWNGYEFFDFIDIQSDKSFKLKGNDESDTFNQLTSTKNQKNINDFLTNLKKKGLFRKGKYKLITNGIGTT